MRITGPLARAASRRWGREPLWDDERFREVRERDLAQPTTGIATVLKATFLCMGLTALLTSGKLVEIAERQPLGPERDGWLAVAEGVDRVANFVGLNRPYDLIQDARGAGDDPGQRIDTIDEVAAQAGLDPVEPTPTTTSTPPVTSTSTTAPGSTTSTTTIASQPLLRQVTDESPLRMYVAGDSQAEFLGQSLAEQVGPRAIEVTIEHHISTSLARPDYFNWPAQLADVIASEDPEAIVLFLGANEYQDMSTADGDRLVRGSDEWQAEWTRRLAITLDLLEADHRHVFWVGQPPMRNARVDEGVDLVNELAQPVANIRSHVSYVDIWELFGGDGDYRERIVGPDGEPIRARVDDGIHLTRTAAESVAAMVMSDVDGLWGFAAP